MSAAKAKILQGRRLGDPALKGGGRLTQAAPCAGIPCPSRLLGLPVRHSLARSIPFRPRCSSWCCGGGGSSRRPRRELPQSRLEAAPRRKECSLAHCRLRRGVHGLAGPGLGGANLEPRRARHRLDAAAAQHGRQCCARCVCSRGCSGMLRRGRLQPPRFPPLEGWRGRGMPYDGGAAAHPPGSRRRQAKLLHAVQAGAGGLGAAGAASQTLHRVSCCTAYAWRCCCRLRYAYVQQRLSWAAASMQALARNSCCPTHEGAVQRLCCRCRQLCCVAGGEGRRRLLRGGCRSGVCRCRRCWLCWLLQADGEGGEVQGPHQKFTEERALHMK